MVGLSYCLWFRSWVHENYFVFVNYVSCLRERERERADEFFIGLRWKILSGTLDENVYFSFGVLNVCLDKCECFLLYNYISQR